MGEKSRGNWLVDIKLCPHCEHVMKEEETTWYCSHCGRFESK